jgi:hypothetical protein
MSHPEPHEDNQSNMITLFKGLLEVTATNVSFQSWQAQIFLTLVKIFSVSYDRVK